MAATARNPGKQYTEFKEQDLTTSVQERTANKFDIYCPQESCRCKLLLAQAATLAHREKSKLSLPKLPVAPGATVSTIEENDSTVHEDTAQSEIKETEESNTTTAPVEDQQAFWRVSNMMAFENIGFSKKLPNGIQFLSCADCDTGPLGYHDSTGSSKEYLIALNRVRYHERS
ncbi:guanine nucleotide exchange factor [Entomortierella parvispora]|uniref:Guanine nucleotide exchange factor n=1 Tax=Entomortierella parvispora TaxID=205924 RepID=A0A9P3HFW3_9FUNG|nr:guanine nucleotide exchange factor [Entomortierella parvispora]